MPFDIKKSVDPLSENAWQASVAPGLNRQPFVQARTDASAQLRTLMEDYIAGNSSGCSVLVAGHRGAGKTTLVHGAYHDLLRDWRLLAGTGGLGRPVLVSLHANEIFNAFKTIPAQGSQTNMRDEQTALLIGEVIAALNRSVLDLMNDSFKHRPILPGRQRDKNLEETRALEAAQFSYALEQNLHDTELLKLWRARRLDQLGLVTKAGRWQGLKELVALQALFASFRKATGVSLEPVGKVKSDPESTSKPGSGSKPAGFFVTLVTYLVSVAGGAATTTNLGGFNNLGAVATGLIVGILGVPILSKLRKYVSVNTVPDYNRVSRDGPREFVHVLKKLRDAGIVPLFFVDELDKLDNGYLLKKAFVELKVLFGEQAFFCFASDAGFYDQLVAARQEDPYCSSSTWFRRELFVAFTPAELRSYLARRIVIFDERRRLTFSVASRLLIKLGASSTASDRTVDRKADLEILISVLLYRSRMHMLRIQRNLRPLVERARADAAIDRGFRSRAGNRGLAYFQLAVEEAIRSSAVQTWIDDHPARLQTVYDAIYEYLEMVEQTVPGHVVAKSARDVVETVAQRTSEQSSKAQRTILAKNVDVLDAKGKTELVAALGTLARLISLSPGELADLVGSQPSRETPQVVLDAVASLATTAAIRRVYRNGAWQVVRRKAKRTTLSRVEQLAKLDKELQGKKITELLQAADRGSRSQEFHEAISQAQKESQKGQHLISVLLFYDVGQTLKNPPHFVDEDELAVLGDLYGRNAELQDQPSSHLALNYLKMLSLSPPTVDELSGEKTFDSPKDKESVVFAELKAWVQTNGHDKLPSRKELISDLLFRQIRESHDFIDAMEASEKANGEKHKKRMFASDGDAGEDARAVQQIARYLTTINGDCGVEGFRRDAARLRTLLRWSRQFGRSMLEDAPAWTSADAMPRVTRRIVNVYQPASHNEKQ